MIPWLIVAVVAVPILVIAFSRMRKKDAAGEHPADETQADRERTEDEFEESERYQEQWRAEQKTHQDDTLIP
jgi:flagellar biosynthesis/type III secretory pathway M-ring protein FliF/YscJ